MPLRKRSKDRYKYWQCRKCKHVVIAKERPQGIQWEDGHICEFVNMHDNNKEDKNEGSD